MSRKTTRLAGVATVAAWFGVTPQTVTKWFRRYCGWPVPDFDTEGVKGWLPEREAEWRAWKASLPGQGAGGGRKPKSPRENYAATDPPQGGDAE
jgi:hypothetical protein